MSHVCAAREWVGSSVRFKDLFIRDPRFKDVGNPVLRSFMNNPGFSGTGYFFTDPEIMYYRGRSCGYTDAAAAETHLRVGHVYVYVHDGHLI